MKAVLAQIEGQDQPLVLTLSTPQGGVMRHSAKLFSHDENGIAFASREGDSWSSIKCVPWHMVLLIETAAHF